jgi:hypothetical protein
LGKASRNKQRKPKASVAQNKPDTPPDEIVDEGGGWRRLTWFNVGDPRWAFVYREYVGE